MSLTTSPEDVLVHLTSPAREKELAQVTKDTRYVQSQSRNLYLPIPRGSRTGGGTTATQLLYHRSRPHTHLPTHFSLSFPFVSPLTSQEIIQKSFDVFCDLDKDGDRVMSHHELKSALQLYSQQLDVNDAQVARIMEIAGQTRPGYLTFSEFYHVYSALNVVTHLQHADVEHLEPVHVRQALEQTGLTPTKGQIEKIFQLGDKYKTADRLGRIDFGEFLKAYVQTTVDAPQIYLHAWHSAGRNSTPYHKPAEVSAFQDFVAGTMAGVALTLVGHPFDTVKVRMQTAGHFRGGLDVLFQTLRKEGVMALFKGMGGPMATIPLVNAVVFASYGKAKEILHKIQPVVKPLNLWEISIAGAFAGLVNCLIVCPVELIKTRLQTQYSYAGSTSAFTGALDCVHRTYVQNGIKGLYRGMAATIYREIPGYGGQFFMYEALKQRFTKPGETTEDLSAPALILAGGTAGIFGWILSYPMDYVKSQIQAEPYDKKTLFTKNKYLFDGGFISCWKHTVREGGYKALFRGFGPCIARAFPANAAGFLAYEWTLKVVRIYDQPLDI